MIDRYCERLDASFWSEPVNALTNVSFIIAGILAVSLLRKTSAQPLFMWVLAGLMLLIGIGSFLFHTFATPLTALADAVPIYAFQLTFMWFYSRSALRYGCWTAGGVIGFFLLVTLASGRIPFALNGSEAYLPAILLLGLFAVLATRQAVDGAHWLAVATLLFAVSLGARTVDEWWCAMWPLGTHFIWHALNGVVVYLSWVSLYRANLGTRQTSI